MKISDKTEILICPICKRVVTKFIDGECEGESLFYDISNHLDEYHNGWDFERYHIIRAVADRLVHNARAEKYGYKKI